MKLFIFLCLVALAGVFHQREHARFEDELRRLLPRLKATGAAALAKADWRLVAEENGAFILRRGFHVTDRDALWRYAGAVAILAAILVYLQNFWLAGFYAAALAVKWFAATTRIDTRHGRYDCRIAGVTVFGDFLAAPEDRPPPAA